MTKTQIPYTKPSITQLEIDYVTDAITNGWGSQCYEYIHKFEKAFGEHLDVEYSIATSSATGALHMGLAALGIGLGDEVIMADTNWIASAAPIVHLGARPIFVDILEQSWCLDPDKIEQLITSKTKAILAVHLYGNLCEMDKLLEIGRRHGIPIIEDAAEAIGSSYHGKRAGSMGEFGVFSFHGTKTMTTGEGGMFVTRKKELYEKVLTLSNHGRARTCNKQFWPETVGYKYKISNVQAAIGLAQVNRIDELIKRKREIFEYYSSNLLCLGGLEMNPELSGLKNGYWMPTVRFKQKNFALENLSNIFKQQGIDARPFFWPLSMTPALSSDEYRLNANAYKICLESINLPSFHDMSIEQLDRVIEIIRKYLMQI
jgi:perosamine synthetase